MDVNNNWIMKAELDVTTKCLGECPFCFGQGDFGKDGKHVPIERLLKRAGILLEYHKKHPFYAVPLLGGEPLLHPDLPELARTYGNSLPFAIVSAGEPDHGADLGQLIDHIHMWGATYNIHLYLRYLSYANKLLTSGKKVETIMHFDDFTSFCEINNHFVTHALTSLFAVSTKWKREFEGYLKSWTEDTYYDSSFTPFIYKGASSSSMMVRYSIIDKRFTRKTSHSFVPPYVLDKKYPCYLFTEMKSIAVTEEGKVVPCTSNAQRHAAPIIHDLDSFGRLPDNLPDYLDRCGGMLFSANEDKICDVRCKQVVWNLDRYDERERAALHRAAPINGQRQSYENNVD